ncbi:hypothetical protein [Planctomyces sp. SH-PL62]|uniref:hypothetical protein n=1 Tax=Planctomyces sp. SH-PL62 TaxID=1636152 RepID=UPI00078E6708|nr:hypothetical protein [Planctomyces sp. SH-PL62]AMV37071.1 hypothetical protein VT85_06545 [Planctomyces sp. SH-PL62]
MNLDIRVPIGLLFLSLGGLMTGFGAVTHFTNPGMYAKSLDINVNLWWGLAMIVFGALMFHFGRRARASASTSAEL